MSEGTDSAIKVGISGLGRSGWSLHALNLQTLQDKYQLVAVCDADSGRQAEARERFGCRAYSKFEDFVKDDEIELVVVAMPSHLHADLAIEAMRAGKHVLVEKPFATDLAGADRMIAVATETGRILTGSQNERYGADFLKVREIIESGKLGQALQIRIAWHRFRRRWDWQTLKELGGGNLNNDGSHVIDQALLLFGDADPEIFCRMERTPLTSGDAEDHVKVVLQAPGSPVIDMEFTDACAFPQDRWLVMCTQGGLTGTSSQLRWKYVAPEMLPARPVERAPTPDRGYNREELPWVEESCDLSKESYSMSNKRLYLDLYPSLRKGSPLAITPESIRRQIAVLERCRELASNKDT